MKIEDTLSRLQAVQHRLMIATILDSIDGVVLAAWLKEQRDVLSTSKDLDIAAALAEWVDAHASIIKPLIQQYAYELRRQVVLDLNNTAENILPGLTRPQPDLPYTQQREDDFMPATYAEACEIEREFGPVTCFVRGENVRSLPERWEDATSGVCYVRQRHKDTLKTMKAMLAQDKEKK